MFDLNLYDKGEKAVPMSGSTCTYIAQGGRKCLCHGKQVESPTEGLLQIFFMNNKVEVYDVDMWNREKYTGQFKLGFSLSL